MQGMLNWDDLRIFLAVQRHGTHAGAAGALTVDPTTVGRRVTALEEALGARLFRRTRGGLVVTDEGARLTSHAERVEAEVLASERALTGARELAGTVRLTAGDGLITYLLTPALGSLLQRHPGLHVELRGEYRTLDLSRREADVALRLSRPQESSLVARRVGTCRFGLFASEAYLARRGRPASEAALAEHDVLSYWDLLDEIPPMKWLLARAGQQLRLRSSTTAAIVAACVAGHGIAFVTTISLQALLARPGSGLVQLFPRAEIPAREMWAVAHADARRHPRVAAVLEWVAATCSEAGMR
jgi:DNA-binding transcriptional LysR family regulator